MGSGVAKLILSKEGIELVGAIAHRDTKIGKDLGEILGLKKKLGVIISSDRDPSQAWRGNDVNILLHATCSTVSDAFPQIRKAIEDGLNVISSAEELAYPDAQNPELAKEIDELAKKHGVSVLGTGINPGFVLDALIIMLTGVCFNVKRIEATRINDLSPYGSTVLNSQGVGTSVEGFRKGVTDGTIVGHVGFPESIKMIADSLGWKLDKVEESREPIVSKSERETPYIKVEPGMVAGCKQIGRGIVNGEERILLVHPQQIHPELEDTKTGDFIKIEGTPPIDLRIEPEIAGGVGTIALMVNMIPAVMNAKPGLVTMASLPIPSALLGDVSTKVRVEG
ncbi:2,4-diaminopentanoate dehydrogenase [Chloroflexota bacterium]